MQGKVKSFFYRDRKILYIILSIVLISVCSLTIVYAALSVTLNIQGNTEVLASTWDIHLENVKVKYGSVSGDNPRITSPTTVTFSTALNVPGDFYEFSVDVVNNGSIDAMIDGVSKMPTLTETQAKYLKYDVEYQNGESINTKQLVSIGSFVRLKVRVEFRKDITVSDLPKQSETLNLSFTVNYVQSDEIGSNVIDNGVKKPYDVITGDLQTVGSELVIEDEHFYLISSDEDKVTLLAKINISTNEPPMQSSSATKVGFSSTNYWSSKVSSYPAYVYDSNSKVYSYAESYKIFLENLGAEIEEVRLIKMEELESLGCSISGTSGSCKSAPSWVYETSYWTGSSASKTSMWFVFNSGLLRISGSSYGTTSYIRPVIVLKI